MDERQQAWRCQQPMASVDRSLQHVRNPVDVGSGPQMLLGRFFDGDSLDVLPQPLPLAHQPEVVEAEIAAQGHRDHAAFG
jgi:hypothetical protein